MTDPYTHTGWRLASLTLGNLVIATGASIVVGILPALVADLQVSASAAGQLGTVYALTACLLGPLLSGISTRFDRRNLLVAILVANALTNLASAVMPGYWWLLASRVLAAAFGVLHTSQAAVTAALLVPPQRRGRAMAMVFLGVAMSSVVGLPLGSWMGAAYGWRITLAAVGALGLLSALYSWSVLPGGLRVPPVNLSGWKAIGRHPLLTRLLPVSVLQYGGQTTLFSYLAVSYQHSVGASAQTISLLLGLFGACAVVGNLVGGRMLDRFRPVHVQAVSISTMFVAFLLWKLGEGSMTGIVIATVVWGLVGFVTNSAQQVRLLSMAPALAPVSVALNTSCIMLGQAVGTAIGGVGLGWFGAGVLPLLGLPFYVAALGLSSHVERRRQALEPAEPARHPAPAA